MINLREYARFKQLEERLLNANIPHRSAHKQVKNFWGEIEQFDYYLHPDFGVVKALNDGGTLVDKSPLCEQYDKELFG